MIIALAYFLNLQHGIGKFETEEEEKDSLENQVIRRVGNLLYDTFNDEFNALITGKNIAYPLFSIISIAIWWEFSRLLILRIYSKMLPAAPMAKRVAAVFFASGDSAWITGETLVIAGGLR